MSDKSNKENYYEYIYDSLRNLVEIHKEGLEKELEMMKKGELYPTRVINARLKFEDRLSKIYNKLQERKEKYTTEEQLPEIEEIDKMFQNVENSIEESRQEFEKITGGARLDEE